MTDTAPECLPPKGTDDYTVHTLSREVGDGKTRETFNALWDGNRWDAQGIGKLSPRKAAWAGWEYVHD